MGGIWSSLSLIQAAKPQGPHTSFPEKFQLGEIGRYGSTSGTNTQQQGTSFMSLLENGWPQPTGYGDGSIALQMTTSIKSRKGRYTIIYPHRIVNKQGWRQLIHSYGRKISLLTLRQGYLHLSSITPITTLTSSTKETHWLRGLVYQCTFGST